LATFGLKPFLLLDIIASYPFDYCSEEFKDRFLNIYKIQYALFIQKALDAFANEHNLVIKESIVLTCCHANNCLEQLVTRLENDRKKDAEEALDRETESCVTNDGTKDAITSETS